MCYVLITIIVSLYFPAIILITSVCLVLLWSCVPVHMMVLYFFICCSWTYARYVSVLLSVHLWMFVCAYVYNCCHTTSPCPLPSIRVPGGECRKWFCAGGCGHPRDQCDRCERRAHAQRRLPAATPWWRHNGCCLWGQPGPPRSWLQHAESGGQEAEVCKADGGEWGFWVGLHREEPVLRSHPSFPLPQSWGNLGNNVWGRGLKKLHDDFPLYLLHWAAPASLRLIALFLSSVYPMSFIHSLFLWLKLSHEDLLKFHHKWKDNSGIFQPKLYFLDFEDLKLTLSLSIHLSILHSIYFILFPNFI